MKASSNPIVFLSVSALASVLLACLLADKPHPQTGKSSYQYTESDLMWKQQMTISNIDGGTCPVHHFTVHPSSRAVTVHCKNPLVGVISPDNPDGFFLIDNFSNEEK